MIFAGICSARSLPVTLKQIIKANKSLPIRGALLIAREMSSKPPPEPRPSASILLVSHRNEVLLLHRVQTSSAFPSAHVFPGGNLSAKQDGAIPAPDDSMRHRDSSVYRIGAIRECFEESGILLARPKGSSNRLLDLSDEARETGRKAIHANEANFQAWVREQGGELDTDGLLPFTRWITPVGVPKRFTTQMYLYFLPLDSNGDAPGVAKTKEALIQNPTHDGGLEHTAAQFLPVHKWLEMAQSAEVIMFPPQFFLMHQMNQVFMSNGSTNTGDSDASLDNATLQAQRDRLVDFVNSGYPPWTEKCISPMMYLKLNDGRQVLSLASSGPELKGSDRRGEEELVVLVEFRKEGPRRLDIKKRTELVTQARQELRASQKGLKI